MDEPWKKECDTCGHERWNHGEDGLKCGHGWEGDCDCQQFRDEEKAAAIAYWTALLDEDWATLLDGGGHE